MLTCRLPPVTCRNDWLLCDLPAWPAGLTPPLTSWSSTAPRPRLAAPPRTSGAPPPPPPHPHPPAAGGGAGGGRPDAARSDVREFRTRGRPHPRRQVPPVTYHLSPVTWLLSPATRADARRDEREGKLLRLGHHPSFTRSAPAPAPYWPHFYRGGYHTSQSKSSSSSSSSSS